MMRRRVSVALLAGVLLAGLIAVPGTPAGAQDIADLPRLGYEIDPTQGFAGDEVHSSVNVDDLREHCWDIPLVDPSGSPLASADSFEIEAAMYWSPGGTQAVLEFFAFDNPFYGDLLNLIVQRWGTFAPEQNPGHQILDSFLAGPIPEGIPDNQDGQNFVNWVGVALNTATSILGLSGLIDALYPGVHVTTFVDPVTQEMVGDMGNFDPESGQGNMDVPDLPSALYAVAAACAFFVPYDELPEGLEAGFVAAWEWSIENDFFPTGPGTAGWQEWAEAGGFPALFSEMVDPIAVGIDFYCILQDDGFCATPPGPVGLIDDDVLEEFNGNGEGEAPGVPGDDTEDGVGAAEAVGASPAFTG